MRFPFALVSPEFVDFAFEIFEMVFYILHIIEGAFCFFFVGSEASDPLGAACTFCPCRPVLCEIHESTADQGADDADADQKRCEPLPFHDCDNTQSR